MRRRAGELEQHEREAAAKEAVKARQAEEKARMAAEKAAAKAATGGDA